MTPVSLTWLLGIFQAAVIGPVLWVPLLQPAVDLCGFVQTLQLQQQLSYGREEEGVTTRQKKMHLNLELGAKDKASDARHRAILSRANIYS